MAKKTSRKFKVPGWIVFVTVVGLLLAEHMYTTPIGKPRTASERLDTVSTDLDDTKKMMEENNKHLRHILLQLEALEEAKDGR